MRVALHAPRLLVFGGASRSSEELADAHLLTVVGTTGDGTYPWSPVTPACVPDDDLLSPRRHHVVVYGGSQGDAMSDLWVLPLRP